MNEEQKQGLNYFKERLPIDGFHLEKECQEHPSLLAEVGTWVSGIRADAKIKKRRVEFLEADLSLKVRRDSENYGLTGKVTEGAIHSVVLTLDEYGEAVSAFIEAERLANESSILLSSVEQRGSSIRDLVKLYIYNYYSSPDNAVTREGWEKSESSIMELRNRTAQEGQEEDVIEKE